MTREQLRSLRRLVRKAQAVVDRPWEPGETSRPIEFFTDHLSEEGWHLGWTLVAALRERHPDLFRNYGENELHREALDRLLEDAPPQSIDEVADFLRERASGDHGEWLVVTPLANVSLDRTWAPLRARAALQRSSDAPESTSAADDAELDDVRAGSEVYRHLGDRLEPASRFLRLGDGTQLETGRTASILSVETGGPRFAVEVARAKAQYAVATWAVLAPPAAWHTLPEVGVWWPQPSYHQQSRHKRLEDHQWIARERRNGGDIRRWAPYKLPDDELLAAPFHAFDRLERRSAQALLSGTAALYSASRGSRSQLSQRIRDVRAAVECLCEPRPGGGGSVSRWQQIARRFDVWERVRANRAYTEASISELQQRLINARNISAHGADAALLDLGWNGEDRVLRRGVAPATDLTRAALQRDLGPMLFAVGEALRLTWNAMREADFEDSSFEDLFSNT